MKKRVLKTSAHAVFLSLVYQLIFPVYSYALTTGPSQPEVQSFEPVGTTDMVNTFSGDFVYNIPLLDVEGYPVNIAYHSGIGIEQEASWVGLGWNINPGEINRSVRGLPDDFNGEKIEKTIHIKGEKNFRIASGANVGFEALGFFNVNVGAGAYINFNNYKGIGVGTNISASASAAGYAGVGVNIGIGSQTGADVDLNANVGYKISKTMEDGGKEGFSASLSGSTGFNSRTGLKNLSFGASVGFSLTNQTGRTLQDKNGKDYKETQSAQRSADIVSTSIPIGLQNFVPVVTNASTQTNYQFQAKLGGEVFYTFPSAYFNVSISSLTYADDGTRKGYGYLYSENASDSAIMDFSRDKESAYNKTVNNLALSSNTYDIYTVSGQGTGGMFRPFRNDIGTVHDPAMATKSSSRDVLTEAGIGNLFEAGMDIGMGDITTTSGPWNRLNYGGKSTGSLYEKAYFKQGGELTYNNQTTAPQLFNNDPEYVKENMSTLKGKDNNTVGSLPAKMNGSSIYWDGSIVDRTTRANLLTYVTAAEADKPEVAQYSQYSSWNTAAGSQRYFDPSEQKYSRYDNSDPYKAHGDHITEFTQTLPDGKRCVYGIPAMNNVSRDVSFDIDETAAAVTSGIITYNASNESVGNSAGRENYYSSTITPAYAHSYLLTAQLSADFVDIMGDGPTDDDLGSYVKFNYTMTDPDYRWRAPYGTHKAQYNPGYWSDLKDGKGTYSAGSRQQWHLRSIETKNNIAEYYISPRQDGYGSTDPVLNTGSSYTGSKSSASLSYELDSIKLYNKHDRYINEGSAVPIKTVYFKYSYALCPGTDNSVAVGQGKLTLEKIYFKYGNSEKNLLSPYSFTYSTSNPAYDFSAKDRWGNYKQNNTALTNYEYPYTSQDDVTGTDPVTSWNLTDVKLPSGGVLHVDYESDDYGFVQNKRAMQMFKIVGVGNGPTLQHQSVLYQTETAVNDYVYFQRNTAKENSKLSAKDNYLEGEDLLYYSFNLDITGTGKFERINGYAKIDEVGYISGTSYGYVKLKREQVNALSLHPATVYGLNIGRFYLPHIFYPGFDDNAGVKNIMMGLVAAARELSIWKNPFSRFIADRKGRNITIDKSWIRMQSPSLAKKGGGIRVKRLTLNDKWNKLSSNPEDAQYGQDYNYTIDDPRYGTISSGVATYEPFIGGDENPFRRPVPYTADGGRLLPAVEFFQEEPFGEAFFPGAEVGYSRVSVKSIHFSEGRSSRSEDEQLFYTAKDFPLSVDYTQKETPEKQTKKSLSKSEYTERVLQGYALRFNDMHGKPKEINNYVINASGAKEKITGTKYNYVTESSGKLSNTVKAFVRERGNVNNYSIKDVTLGKEMDFTIDSRSKYFRSYTRTIQTNLNVVMWGVPPLAVIVPIPTSFFPEKEDIQQFSTMVSTKIIQQYGIVKSTETYDHGAKTINENVIYDAETGSPLLTKTNNEYNDNTYSLTSPAYLAYSGMGPAYSNINYEEKADSFVVNSDGNGYLYVKDANRKRFEKGDELLVTIAENPYLQKLWVLDFRNDNTIIHPLCPVGETIPGSGGPTAGTKPGTQRCALVVAPRYKFRYNAGSNLNIAAWPTTQVKYLNVTLKVIRSGRRNQLNKSVQQTAFTVNPYNTASTNPQDLFSSYTNSMTAFNNVLSTSATTYTDSSQAYDDYLNTVATYSANGTSSGERYIDLCHYSLGYRGNFRPLATFAPVINRNYSPNHSRYNGTYRLDYGNIYNFQNGNSHNNEDLDCRFCVDDYNVMNAYSTSGWTKVQQVTKYDVYGNAIEEVDAIGNYSSALYGYNKQFPVAVASNTHQQNFFFDGFEDYRMLLPEFTRRLYVDNLLSGADCQYKSSPFYKYFDRYETSITNTTATNATMMLRYGQRYSINNLISSNNGSANTNLTVTNAESHTGNYSLKNISSDPFGVTVAGDNSYNNEKFFFTAGKKYLVDVWVKPISSSGTVSDGSFYFSYANTSTTTGLTVKTTSIDGWYLMEGIVDLAAISTSRVFFNLPANTYIDDIRTFPSAGNMKSFVYDPLNLRLMAELDENHFATFYEYDQEGLLVRVKKETERGILTVSENRRSNSKLQ